LNPVEILLPFQKAQKLANLISSLSSFSRNTENKPVIKFYENYSGIRTILEDVP
jgi:hypothetical protein